MKKTIARFATILIGLGPIMSSGAFAGDLESTMRAALANSTSLAAARQTWISVREDIATNSSTKDWSATGTISGTQARTDSALLNDGFKDKQTGVGTISFTKNLYDGGQQSENIKLDEQLLVAQSASYAASEQSVLLEAIEAHLAVVKAAREVALNQDNLRRMESHVEAAKVRVEAGAATPTRLAEANARLARAKSSLISAQTAFLNASDEFHSLTGTEAADLAVPPILENLPTTLIEAEEIARNEHPSIQKALANEAAALQSFETLRAAVRPSLALTLSASDTYSEGLTSDSTVLSAQVKLSTPLMVTPATRAKSRNLSAKLASSKYTRDDTFREVGLSVRQTFRSLETAQAQVTAVQAEVEASRLVARGITNEFEFGQKTSLDVQDAEQDVNDAEIRLVAAQHDQLISVYRLQAALGRLTARAMGLEEVLGPLQSEPVPSARFTSIRQLFGND